jgi:hypothetical protein
MFVNEGQVRLWYPPKAIFTVYFSQMLRFETKSTLQTADYHRVLHLIASTMFFTKTTELLYVYFFFLDMHFVNFFSQYLYVFKWYFYSFYLLIDDTFINCKSFNFKGIMSKLTITFWMCQKCGTMKDYQQKMTTSAVKWLQTHWIW